MAISEKTKKRSFFLVKCDTFDKVTFQAERGAIDEVSFAINSNKSIKEGLKRVRLSPFKTVFVINEANNRPLFAISQNKEYVMAAKKKKDGGGGDGPDIDPVGECCDICLARGYDGCLLDERMNCWCLTSGRGDLDDAGVTTTPFTSNDSLSAILEIL